MVTTEVGPSGWDRVPVLQSSKLNLLLTSVFLLIDTDGVKTRSDFLFSRNQAHSDVGGCLCQGSTKQWMTVWEEVLGMTADMATQWSGWKVDTTPLVVDDLGSLRCFMQGGALQITAVSGREILRLVCCAQFKVSCLYAVWILRRYLSSEWQLSCSVCFPWPLCQPHVHRIIHCRKASESLHAGRDNWRKQWFLSEWNGQVLRSN